MASPQQSESYWQVHFAGSCPDCIAGTIGNQPFRETIRKNATIAAVNRNLKAKPPACVTASSFEPNVSNGAMLVDFRTAIAHLPPDCTRVRALRRPFLEDAAYSASQSDPLDPSALDAAKPRAKTDQKTGRVDVLV